MNISEIKEKNYIMFETITGSHAYGLNRPDSDLDIRGIFKVPKDMHLSLFHPPQEVGDDKQDIKYYELKKFFALAADCNPNIIELLYSPQNCVKICTPLMQKIIDNRNLFISKKAYYTFSGYAHAQIDKAKGQNKLINNPKPTDPPLKEEFCWFIPDSKCGTNFFDKNLHMPFRPVVLDDWNSNLPPEQRINLDEYHAAALEHVPNTYRLYYYGKESKGIFRGTDMLVCESIPKDDEWEKFAGILIYNQHEYEKAHKEWKNYWNWVKNRNEARWTLQENKKVDFDAKNMMHCVRLLWSGKNILTKGEPIVKFEGEQRQFLMDIRTGRYDYQTLMKLAEQEMNDMEKLKEASSIPHSVNMNNINGLYMEIANEII